MTERFENNPASDIAALYQASLRLNSSLALPDVLDELVRAALGIIDGLTSIRIFIREDETLVHGTAWWSGSPTSGMNAQSVPDELVYRAAASSQMVSVRKSGVHIAVTSTAMPLMIGANVVGVLAFTRPGEQELAENAKNALMLLADQAALAIKNAVLFQRISQQAYTDFLTGLPNRRAFDMRLDEETRRSSRYQHPFTLIMFDVDGFKQINDQHGHPFGDHFLQHLIGCLRGQLRETDFFARFGGDEFAIILPETDYEIASSLSRRLETVAEGCAIELPEGQSQAISISVGLASYPRHAISAAALMIAADQALYRAKRLEDAYLDNS